MVENTKDIKSYKNKKITIGQIINYYKNVQTLLHKHFVFPYCLTSKAPQNLSRAPKDFESVLSSLKDQHTKDAIFTLWNLSQKNIEQKRKLLHPPYIPPPLGYDKNSFKGEFRTFYSKKDPAYLVREKIKRL